MIGYGPRTDRALARGEGALEASPHRSTDPGDPNRRGDPGSPRRLGPATATIDLDALRENASEAARLAAGRRLIAVVKADAYGHGAVPVARALVAGGCSALATWSVGEAIALRDAGIRAPLLVLAGVRDGEEAEEAVARELACVLHDAEGRAALARAARRRGTGPARVQLEIDTGMRRMGIPAGEAADFAAAVAADPDLSLEGVLTHFARADEPGLEPTLEQLRAFKGQIGVLRERGIDPGTVHAANSAGLVALAELAGEGPPQDAVRPGLLLYGAQPSSHRAARLRPVMTLSAPVVALRTVRRGEAVGYAARYRAAADTRVATLGLGYADGVPIAASGRGSVWLAGARRPIAGRVSMDYVGVEVGDAPVQIGDRAILFGGEKPAAAAVLPVEEAAEAADTLAYELLVRVGARVRREVVGSDGIV